jgi:hypothetical protein
MLEITVMRLGKNKMREQIGDSLTMQGPAIYRIIVRGTLDPDWSNRMAGMSITEKHGAGSEIETVLVGRLADQTALASVLNALYELHLPVVSADCLESG